MDGHVQVHRQILLGGDFRPDDLEDVHDPVDDLRPVAIGDELGVAEQVNAEREVLILHIQHERLSQPGLRQVGDALAGQIAVRVDHHYGVTFERVVVDQAFEQTRFSHSLNTENVEAGVAVGIGNEQRIARVRMGAEGGMPPAVLIGVGCMNVAHDDLL